MLEDSTSISLQGIAMPGGRPCKGVWHYFIKHPGTTVGSTRATCKGCHEEMSPNPARMEKHAQSCVKLITAGFTGQLEDEVEEPVALGPPVKKRKVKQELLQPVVTDRGTKELLDLQLTRFIVGANLPFRCVTHPEFVKLIRQLRPGYTPADRKTIAGSLLDDLYRKAWHQATKMFNGSMCTLQMDGWTSPSHDPTLVTSVQINGQSFLLEVEDTNGQPHTAEWMATRLLDHVKAVERDFGVKVVGVTTDSASNMKKMKELAAMERPDLLYMPCTAHWLHLAGKDCGQDGPARR
jgi:hypothetical protein